MVATAPALRELNETFLPCDVLSSARNGSLINVPFRKEPVQQII
jgi:hypothetical protein